MGAILLNSNYQIGCYGRDELIKFLSKLKLSFRNANHTSLEKEHFSIS